ncbi:MAG: hypothetical protein ACKPJD_26010, partial [Planctomycetaceae bacterium]
LSVAGVDGAMAILVPKNSADKRRWVAAAGTGNAVSLVGLPDLSISATNFAVELNKSLGTATGGIPNASIVDFNANPLNFLMDDGSTVTITHPASSGALLKVATDATITVADFFRVNGSFGVQTSTRDVSLSDGSSVNADVLMLGGKNASAFAGVNGGSANAAGLALTGVDFGFITATDKLDGARRWNTLQATAANVAALGIPDTTVTGSNLAVAISRPDENGLVANYKNDPINIPLGNSQTYTVNIDGAKGALLQASGTLTVSVSDFFKVTGSFALQRVAASVTLASGTTANVSLLTLGIDNGSAFLGLNPGDANAAGLSITNADAAIAVATDVTDPTKRWTAVEASLDGISVTGLAD